MSDSRKISLEKVASEPWGPELLREMDLVIATNALASLRGKRTLYNSDLNLKVAERCMPIDRGYRDRRLDTIHIPPNEEEWRRVPAALSAIASEGRGTWAVFEKDGRFDAYMADGYGGTATESGHKFTKTSPLAASLNATTLYGHVLSYMTYLRRNVIENAILEHSFRVADVKPGETFRELFINGKLFNRVEVVAVRRDHYVGGSDAVELKATRRGVKAASFLMPATTFAQKLGLELVLPPEFDDPENEERLTDEFRLDPAGTPSPLAPRI